MAHDLKVSDSRLVTFRPRWEGDFIKAAYIHELRGWDGIPLPRGLTLTTAEGACLIPDIRSGLKQEVSQLYGTNGAARCFLRGGPR